MSHALLHLIPYTLHLTLTHYGLILGLGVWGKGDLRMPDTRLQERFKQDGYMQWFIGQVQSFGEHRRPVLEWWAKLFTRIELNTAAMDAVHGVFSDAKCGESTIDHPLKLLVHKLKLLGVIFPKFPDLPKKPKPKTPCSQCGNSGILGTGWNAQPCDCPIGAGLIAGKTQRAT